MNIRSMALLASVTLTGCASVTADQTITEPFKDWHRGWNVKTAISSAQVIMVARVTHVGKVKVVEGAKTNQYFREFRLQPLEVIKGVYSRPELTMSASDLGCRSAIGTEAADIQEGQLRLLMLSQSNPLGTSFGCASVASTTNFRQAVPLLNELGDPIVGMYKSMIKVNNLRSRQQRVDALVKTINNTDGPAVVPLLGAIADDLIWAASHESFVDQLLEISRHEDPIIANAGFHLVCSLPHWFTSKTDKQIVKDYADRIKQLVSADEVQNSKTRLNALRAAIELEKLAGSSWLVDLLIESVEDGRTFAEQRLAVSGLGDLRAKESLAALKRAFQRLPLDASADSEKRLADAIQQVDETSLFTLLETRFNETLLAGENLKHEIELLAKSDNDQAVTMLMAALDDSQATGVHGLILTALGNSGSKRAVGKLGDVLRNRPKLRHSALHALIKIGDKAAAVELRPHLKTNRQLYDKLLIANVLAEHGMDDGYSIAIEHLADGGNVTRIAAEVLRELDRAETRKQLLDILKTRPDQKWYLGSVAGLMAMDNEEGRKAFVQIVSDDRHPLLSGALAFSDFAGKAIVVENAAGLVESRNDQIAMSAIAQIKKIVDDVSVDGGQGKPNQAEQKLLKSLTRVASDSYINSKVRLAALDLISRYDTPEVDDALIELADRVDLVGRKTMSSVQNEIKRREIDLASVN